MSMRIRRDRSSLHFGRRPRHKSRRIWLFWAWFLTMAAALGIIWQLDRIQPSVMAVVNGPPTATPDAVSLAQLAQDAYWEGDLEASISYYSQASDLEPENTSLQFEYIRVLAYGSYQGRGFEFRAEEALDVAIRTVELAPRDAYAQAGYALALIVNDRSDEAAAAALNATELAPNWAEARAYLSMAYYDQDRYNSAQEQAQQAVNLDPTSVDARRALALAMAFTGDYDVAIRQYEAAVAIHPNLDVLYFELAVYYVILDNYDAAIQSLDRILAHDSRNVKAWTRKCEYFFRQRDDPQAQEACEQAVELDNTFPEAHKQLGMVRYTRRNYEGAIESFATCIQLMEAQGIERERRLVECYYLHGLAYYLLDRCDQAMPLFEEALLIDSSEVIRNLTLEGMQLCAQVDENYSSSDVPTVAPPTPPR
ncbi:MAG: tetratricopeptide repeat protein, partial [Chloroflexi bacterium]|nr:tetratricopeptide repeat protein [Chloroflexota bacterium]